VCPFTQTVKPDHLPTKIRQSRYALSTRSLIELELYLRRTFEGDVPECTHCTELCLLGYACTNDENDGEEDDSEAGGACKVYIHKHCYSALRRAATATNPLKCPTCSTDWSNAGEDDARGKAKGKAKDAGVRKIGEWGVPEGYEDRFFRRKRRSAAASEEEEQEDEEQGMDTVVDAVVEEEELLESPPGTPPPTKPKRGKLVKKAEIKK